MNQILDTGEEQFKNNNINYGNYNQNKKQKVYKEKSVIEINKIVIFFAISILILGICIIAGSIYAKDKINKNIEENATPVVNFNFNEDESSVDISVHHPKGITQVIYTLNNQDEKVIEGNNQQDIKTTVKLDGGKNKIVVKATDEMNHLVEYEQEYTVGNLAQIDLNNVDNAVKLTVTSVEKIKKVSYKWDDEQEKVIEVNSTQYSERIIAPVGKHTLKIEVIDDKADVVVANILAEIICILTDDVKRVLKDNGIFITSGIIHDRVDMVCEKLEATGFEVIEKNRDGEWNCIVAKLK